jgi:hypothetical protein
VNLPDDRNFTSLVEEAERVAGETARETFSTAVGHLRDWLARHDPTLYEALEVGWDELVDADLALAPNLKLELRLPRRRPIRVRAQAHIMRSPLQLSFVDLAAAGFVSGGGRAIAALFGKAGGSAWRSPPSGASNAAATAGLPDLTTI